MSHLVKQVPLSPVLARHSVLSNFTQVIKLRNFANLGAELKEKIFGFPVDGTQ